MGISELSIWSMLRTNVHKTLDKEHTFRYDIKKNKCLHVREDVKMKKKYRIKSKFRFILFLTVVLIALFSFAGTAFGMTDSECLTKDSYTQVLIQSGDTLWDLASQFGPTDQDTRAVIYEICQINDISADQIYPGQTILIPRYL